VERFLLDKQAVAAVNKHPAVIDDRLEKEALFSRKYHRKRTGFSTVRPYGSGYSSGSKNTDPWTSEEHQLFRIGLDLYGKEWEKIAKLIKTRTIEQICSHAQAYFRKVAKARVDVGSKEMSGTQQQAKDATRVSGGWCTAAAAQVSFSKRVAQPSGDVGGGVTNHAKAFIDAARSNREMVRVPIRDAAASATNAVPASPHPTAAKVCAAAAGLQQEAQTWAMLQNRLDPRVYAKTMGVAPTDRVSAFGMLGFGMPAADPSTFVLNTATIPRGLGPKSPPLSKPAPPREISEKRRQRPTQLREGDDFVLI
jgi:SHAQKYF class myb-like DNA-binding protein